MKRTEEWEALNRIWKALTVEQREELYNDFELIHGVIKKNQVQEEEQKKEVVPPSVIKEEYYRYVENMILPQDV